MVLIKVFSEEKWAKAFYRNGEMLFRSTSYFAGIENDKNRQDSFEGRVKEEHFLPRGQKAVVTYIAAPLIYCMIYIENKNDYASELKEKIKKLGNWCVIVTKADKFISKCTAYFARIDPKGIKHKKVTYHGDSYFETASSYDLFDKPLKHKGQHEYRFVVGYLSTENIKLFNEQRLDEIKTKFKIGAIKNISFLIPIEDIPKYI